MQFVADSFRMLSDLFSYRPSISSKQFLCRGFAERKLHMVSDVILAVIEKKKHLAPVKHSSLSATRRLSIHPASVIKTLVDSTVEPPPSPRTSPPPVPVAQTPFRPSPQSVDLISALTDRIYSLETAVQSLSETFSARITILEGKVRYLERKHNSKESKDREELERESANPTQERERQYPNSTAQTRRSVVRQMSWLLMTNLLQPTAHARSKQFEQPSSYIRWSVRKWRFLFYLIFVFSPTANLSIPWWKFGKFFWFKEIFPKTSPVLVYSLLVSNHILWLYRMSTSDSAESLRDAFSFLAQVFMSPFHNQYLIRTWLQTPDSGFVQNLLSRVEQTDLLFSSQTPLNKGSDAASPLRSQWSPADRTGGACCLLQSFTVLDFLLRPHDLFIWNISIWRV